MIVLEARSALVTALAYSPDGQTLALGGSDGRVTLWDPFAGSQRLACVPLGPHGQVCSLSFSAAGRLVAAGLQGSALVWSASSGQQLHWHRLTRDEAFTPHPTLAAFHPSDEERLALAHGRLDVVEVTPLSDRRLRSLSHRLPNYQWALPSEWQSLGYVGTALAAGTRDYVVLWHGVSCHTLHWASGPFVALGGDTSGGRLAAGRGRGVAVWELPSAFTSARRWRSFRVGDKVNAVALTPDGRTLLAAGNDWTVHVWDVEVGQKRVDYNWRLGQVIALAVAPGGMTAAATGRKGPQVLIWDLEV